MTIVVTKPGLLTTVQDLGRSGWRRWGVPAGGALDEFSHRQANLLVGNSDDAATLEVTLRGPTLRFDTGVLIAVCGGVPHIELAGKALPMRTPVWLGAGSELALRSITHGCRTYLAIAGGIDVPPVLDSRSTHPTLQLGGWHGRALRAGDSLAVGPLAPWSRRLVDWLQTRRTSDRPWVAASWSAGPEASTTLTHGEVCPIRIFAGRQRDWFSAAIWERLLTSTFEVSPQSNRVGLRLSGPALSEGVNISSSHAPAPRELLSEGMAPGAIQVPHHGQPMVILADGPPTGGYAKIAQVFAVDLTRLGQLAPGAKLQFKAGSYADACCERDRRERYFHQLRLGLLACPMNTSGAAPECR